jgi:HK97 family phage major capsid protein
MTTTVEVKDPVQRLKEHLAELTGQQASIFATADSQNRSPSDDELKRLVEIEAEQKRTANEIERRLNALDAMSKLTAVEPSKVSSEIAHTSAAKVEHRSPITGGFENNVMNGKGGFASGQDWVKAVKSAAVRADLVDKRLTAYAAQTVFANEGAGPEGGWAMPTEFASGIVEAVAGQASLLGRMKPMNSNSNVYQAPIDETLPWGTAGVQAAKTAEGAATTATNLLIQARTVTLYKATALANVSEELQTDNPAVVQHLTRVMAGRLQAIVERWILRGSGVGEPLGILNAPALVSVAAEASGNASGTLIRQNLAKMAGRLIPGFESEAFIVVSPSAKIAINDILLSAGGNTGSQLQSGFGPGILGYPSITSMEAAAVGTVGDATIVAPSGFMTLVKGGINSQATIFFAFDQGLTTLRSYIRLGQIPILSTPVVPKLDTATTLSHCVSTATRTG